MWLKALVEGGNIRLLIGVSGFLLVWMICLDDILYNMSLAITLHVLFKSVFIRYDLADVYTKRHKMYDG